RLHRCDIRFDHFRRKHRRVHQVDEANVLPSNGADDGVVIAAPAHRLFDRDGRPNADLHEATDAMMDRVHRIEWPRRSGGRELTRTLGEIESRAKAIRTTTSRGSCPRASLAAPA